MASTNVNVGYDRLMMIKFQSTAVTAAAVTTWTVANTRTLTVVDVAAASETVGNSATIQLQNGAGVAITDAMAFGGGMAAGDVLRPVIVNPATATVLAGANLKVVTGVATGITADVRIYFIAGPGTVSEVATSA
jgi:hypothetical protein